MLATTALLLLVGPGSSTALPSTPPLATALIGSALRGTDDSVAAARALELRNSSNDHWSGERYAQGAEALREALAIYAALNSENGVEGHVEERAMTLRALVWNEFRAGEEAEALEHFEDLVELAAGHATVLGERTRAYSAVYEHAGRQSSVDAVERFWGAIEDVFVGHDDSAQLAQLLHDRAASYSALGDLKSARRDLQAAIRARVALGDHDGANWSRNNLGYSFVEDQDWGHAIAPIARALAETRQGRGLSAQSSLGHNLLTIASGALEGSRPDRQLVASMWKIAEAEAGAGKPAMVAPERLLVAAMKLEVARAGAKRAKSSAERLLRAMPEGPDALRVDLALHATEVMSSGDAHSDAAQVLDGIVIPDGPVAVHLRARRYVQRACAAAGSGDEAAFNEAVELAQEALQELGHHGTTSQGLERLAAAAEEFPGSEIAFGVRAAWDEQRSKSQPGGAGGSSSGTDRSPYMKAMGALGNQDPLFAISVRGGELVVRDLLAGDEHVRPLEWRSRSTAWNGMQLELFGGYVRVIGVNYGRGGAAKGARGGASLSDMRNYRPLDDELMLLVTKTGATFYGTVEE